jgi:hypothetical protein
MKDLADPGHRLNPIYTYIHICMHLNTHIHVHNKIIYTHIFIPIYVLLGDMKNLADTDHSLNILVFIYMHITSL